MKCLKAGVLWMLAAASAVNGAPLADLRAQDQRLLRIADPILADNARLCDRTMPDLGVSLQSTDQYPANSQPGFAAPVAFAAVLPGSAAADGGIARDDGLLSVDGSPVVKQPELANAPLRDSAFAAIAAHDPARPLVLGIIHGGVRRDISVAVKPECRAQVEILDVDDNTAHSDGRTIQIAFGLAARVSDDELAVIFAHELGHSILHHRERLSAAGADNGLLGQLGRSRRLNLEAEKEADRLSVYLLANAHIDPHAAPNFWRSEFGRRLSGGIFHNLAHPSAKARAEMMEAEIAQHIRPGEAAYPTDLLAHRNDPMQ